MLIGERLLHVQVDSAAVAIPVRLYAPEKGSDGGWFCRYSIGWPHGQVESEGWGHDALQALTLTLQMIGGQIYASPYHSSGKLAWEVPGQGYGFPVTRNVRDLLIGDDARFDG